MKKLTLKQRVHSLILEKSSKGDQGKGLRYMTSKDNKPAVRIFPSLVERLKSLHINETPTDSLELTQNYIDFENGHLVYNGYDLNISRVIASDHVQQNTFGKLMEKIIETQLEPTVRNGLAARPEGTEGFILTDRNTLDPAGHIYFFRSHFDNQNNYSMELIYLGVHPNYNNQGFSKMLRQILFHHQLNLAPDKEQCKKIYIAPYRPAREQVYPYFKRLDPDLIDDNPKKKTHSRYWLNPETVKKNLPHEFIYLNTKVIG